MKSDDLHGYDSEPPNGLRYWRWGGADKVWEQKKLEARKILENGDESHLSSARFVGRRFMVRLSVVWE
jgi:hypothetical protein